MKDIAFALVEAGKISEDDAAEALSRFDNADAFWTHYVRNGFITEKELFHRIADYHRLEFIDLENENLELSLELVSKLPDDFCKQNRVIPIGEKDDYLFLATYNPYDITVIDEAASIIGTEYIIAPKVITPSVLNELIARYLRSDAELSELSEELAEDGLEAAAEDIDTDEDDDSSVIRFVNILIEQAISDRASDIHVEPNKKGLGVRFRIDGVLKDVQQASKSAQAAILSRIKIMANIDIAEKRKPGDGRITVKHNGQHIDIRVASLPTVWGEMIIMRILDNSTERTSLDGIGMSEDNLIKLRRSLAKPHGMILVTGPTGSGKSTTLYTSIDEVADTTVKVITVEDPVEKRIDGVNQVQINNKAGMTFPVALRSILRSDPDIVLVGEIRDSETAMIAVEAALTGHLVLSTLHTNNAPSAATRLIEMGVEPYLASTAISAIVAQRLARRLCGRCKTKEPINQAHLRSLEFTDAENITELYRPQGCNDCSGTGYRGRVALMEVMEVNEEIEHLIGMNRPASEIREEARKASFRSIREDGWRRVLDGDTTVEEVLRVAA